MHVKRFHPTMIRPCVASLMLTLVATTLVGQAAGEPVSGTLVWANGDRLPGQLCDSPASQLLWQSPIFSEPFVLDVKYLRELRFTAAEEKVESDEPIHFITRSGDILFGRVDDVTPKHIVIHSERHGAVKLLRSELRRFWRLHSPAIGYVGPTGTAGWRTLSRTRRISEWKTSAEGALSTNVVGAELFRDLGLPETSEIDVALSWKGKPGFLIAFASQKSTRLSREMVRLETWDDELVLQTLASNGDFEQLVTLANDLKMIRLRLFWNRVTGELSVYSEHGELLGTMKGGPESGKVHSGIYIQNKGSDLSVVHLRVSTWKSGPAAEPAGRSYIRRVDGEIIEGELRAYDPSSQSLVVDVSGTEQRLAIDQIASFDLGERPGEAEAKAKRHEIQLSCYDGTRIGGRLDSVRGGFVLIRTDYCEEPISCQLSGARELAFRDSGSVTRDRANDLLEFRGIKLHGTLAPAGAKGALGWRPVGGANASPFSLDHPARITRDVKDSDEPNPNREFGDIVFLRNGDVIPCRVETIDDQHVHIKTAFAAATAIPNEKVKAAEFDTKANLSMTGFRSRGWVVTSPDDDAIKLTDDKVVFYGPGTLAHESLLRGDEVQFDLNWKTSATVSMRIGLRTRNANSASASSLLVYCAGPQLLVRGLRAGRQMQRAFVQAPMPRRGQARFRMSLHEDELQVFVDDRRVLSQTLDDQERAGNGIVFTVDRMGGAGRVVLMQPGGGRLIVNRQPEELLTITNFRIGRSGRRLGSPHVREEDKQRVLTVPRQHKKNPPTHVLVAQTGDVLRGRLRELTAKEARFTSRRDDFAFPRKRLAGIIWLEERGDPSSPTPPVGRSVQAVSNNGATFTFAAQAMVGESIVGTHAFLGSVAVPLDTLRELQIGEYEENDQLLAYADWILTPAKEPKFATPATDGETPATEFGIDSPLVGMPAEDFGAELLDGRAFRLSDHADQIIVLDFWATWCVPCVKALPQMIEAVGAFPKEKVLLVAVNQQENTERIREFLETRGWQMTVALDRDGRIGRQFQVEAIPQTVIIGPGGKIERLHVGTVADLKDRLEEVLQELVGQLPPGTQQDSG